MLLLLLLRILTTVAIIPGAALRAVLLHHPHAHAHVHTHAHTHPHHHGVVHVHLDLSLRGLGLVGVGDLEALVGHLIAVKVLNSVEGGGGALVLHKTKAAALLRLAVADDADGLGRSIVLEQLAELSLVNCRGDVVHNEVSDRLRLLVLALLLALLAEALLGGALLLGLLLGRSGGGHGENGREAVG